MHFQSKSSLQLECGGERLECRSGQTLMKRKGEVCALITEGLPAISKEIWVSEPDKDMSRDAIAFACCLSLSSNPAALVLSPLVSIYTGWENVTRLHSLCSLVLDKFLSSTFQAFLSCFLCFLLFYFPMFFFIHSSSTWISWPYLLFGPSLCFSTFLFLFHWFLFFVFLTYLLLFLVLMHFLFHTPSLLPF